MNPDFAQLYDEQYQRVYHYVYYRLLHPQQTEDVVSEVFFRAFDAFSQYDGRQGASAATWLFAIARNAVTDHRRKAKRAACMPIEEGLLLEDLSADELTAREQRQQLRALLAELDDRPREALTLRYWGDLSYAEIAAQMGLSEKNVSVILARAIAKLRRHKEIFSCL